jgi:hypothetical protein
MRNLSQRKHKQTCRENRISAQQFDFLEHDLFFQQRYALNRVKTVATLYIEKKRESGSHMGKIFLDGWTGRQNSPIFQGAIRWERSGRLLRKARSHQRVRHPLSGLKVCHPPVYTMRFHPLRQFLHTFLSPRLRPHVSPRFGSPKRGADTPCAITMAQRAISMG